MSNANFACLCLPVHSSKAEHDADKPKNAREDVSEPSMPSHDNNPMSKSPTDTELARIAGLLVPGLPEHFPDQTYHQIPVTKTIGEMAALIAAQTTEAYERGQREVLNELLDYGMSIDSTDTYFRKLLLNKITDRLTDLPVVQTTQAYEQGRREAFDKIFELAPKQNFEHWGKKDIADWFIALGELERSLTKTAGEGKR